VAYGIMALSQTLGILGNVSIVEKTETLRQPVVTKGLYSQLPFCAPEGQEDGEVLRMLTSELAQMRRRAPPLHDWLNPCIVVLADALPQITIPAVESSASTISRVFT